MGTPTDDANASGDEASSAEGARATLAAPQLVAPAENRSPPINMRLLTRSDERALLAGTEHHEEGDAALDEELALADERDRESERAAWKPLSFEEGLRIINSANGSLAAVLQYQDEVAAAAADAEKTAGKKGADSSASSDDDMPALAPIFSSSSGGGSATVRGEAKRAHPGGRIVHSSKRAALSAVLKRTAEPTPDQLRAAGNLKLYPNGERMPVSWEAGVDFCERDDGKHAAFKQRRRDHLPAAEGQDSLECDELQDNNHAAPAVPATVLAAAEARRLADGRPANEDDAVVLSHAISRGVNDQDPHVDTQAAGDADAELFLISGSSRPHAADGAKAQHQRADGWAPAGSLRRLEAELSETLAGESLPLTNVMRVTEPEPPPSPIVNPPGPFKTKVLIPKKAFDGVSDHRRKARAAMVRAAAGPQAWAVAKSLRPAAFVLEEHEALNECGWGHTWQKQPLVDLWHVVQPSSWPHSPPHTTLNIAHVLAEAEALGFTDKQLLSWFAHGFPGAARMPTGRVVMGYPHVGALQNVADFEALAARDIANGFVTSGQEFPHVWPCVVDCMNIVIQHGKPRMTIDKRIRLSSKGYPDGVDSYNDMLDLEAEREEVGKLKLPCVWMFTRAAAILQTSGFEVLIGKFDLATYFRMHGKQRLHIFQSGRLFGKTGFGADLGVNFGERDAMDHTCRASDYICFLTRVELRRLDEEYPSKAAGVMAYVLLRMGKAKEAGAPHGDRDFVWCALFFFFFFVDDAGLAAINDPLYNRAGEPFITLTTQNDGTVGRVHTTRAHLYFRAAMNIARLVGHDTPLKKQVPMGRLLELLGIDVDLQLQRRLLSRIKREAYGACLVEARAEAKPLAGGGFHVEYTLFNPMVHKLLSACEVIPLGRQHLYHTRKALRTPNRLPGHRVVYGAAAVTELDWWSAQLALSAEHGLPLATRWDFPVSSDTTIVHYGDASREETDPGASGYGAWAVIGATFLYFESRWTARQVARFSINVLETVTKDAGTFTFLAYARSIGLRPTHSLAFVDNTAAEHVAENGRTTADSLHALNLRRQQRLVAEGIHQATERVTSVDNDVADMLSRGDVAGALRFPRSAGLAVVRLVPDVEMIETESIPPTWE